MLSRRLILALVAVGFSSIGFGAEPSVTPLPDDPACTADDRRFMLRAFEIARAALDHGNTAFGALLVKDGVVLLEFENDALTSRDVTHHAETGLISVASRKFDRATFAAATLYTSSEPCIMCCGAIRSAGLKRFVYGSTSVQVARLRGNTPPANPLNCREVFTRLGATDTQVLGPLLETEALAVHAAALARAAKK